jgi:hypothetical protein
MRHKLQVVLTFGLGLAVWGATLARTHAQFGVQIQIGGGPFGVVGPYGPGVYPGMYSGMYSGGFNVPFGVGPSIPPTSRAYMGPQYRPGYRGYYGSYGVAPSLGVYGSPLDNPLYESRANDLLRQQYALQRQQLELQATQRSLSRPQSYPFDQQRYSAPPSRGSSASSDLRPGMVLPDGSTVISVGPITAASSSAPQSSVQPATPTPSTVPAGVVPPNVVPPGSEPKKAAF